MCGAPVPCCRTLGFSGNDTTYQCCCEEPGSLTTDVSTVLPAGRVPTLSALPQLFDAVLTQVPAHRTPPPEQTQDPPPHVSGDVHTVPQLPQFCGSFERSRQTPPQLVRPVPQVAWHVPPLQSCPAAHVLLHDPQCSRSVLRSLQTPLQSVRPDPHDT